MAKRKPKKASAKPGGKRKRDPPMRLACYSCDRDDYDGVYRIPKTWIEVHRHQTLAESLATTEENDRSRSAFEWYTHLGQCPECQQADS